MTILVSQLPTSDVTHTVVGDTQGETQMMGKAWTSGCESEGDP